MPSIPLCHSDFTYSDLFSPTRLEALDASFLDYLAANDEKVFKQLSSYRACRGEGYADRDESNLLVDAAPYVGEFLARLFGIEARRQELIQTARDQAVIFEFKKLFIQRRLRKVPAEDVLLAVAELESLELAVAQIEQAHVSSDDVEVDEELRIARLWNATKDNPEESELLLKWMTAMAVVSPERFAHWVSWRQPHHLDYGRLVDIERRDPVLQEVITTPDSKLRRRHGFKLTDRRASDRRDVLDEVNYCLYCHERDKDSCSKGFIEKDLSYRNNALGIPLTGCPLDEKISEAHVLGSDGDVIAALALIMIDNPMCPGTGHRVCNDCMKSCIFQKQEPVNIPLAETGALTGVLRLPWGVEIYGLLTRWNPLNAKRPFPLPYNGRKVLVVGMGPAGYTLAHHLLNEGFAVVGIDGLKIEPLPFDLTIDGLVVPQPIINWSDIYRELDDRVLEGFGGVSEYGITARWDKNFLTLLHLTLSRRERLRIYGGVRFGGTLTIDDAWELGFDHIAIATGAGRPTIVDMKNNLIPGIRKASDVLMALQLTGAFKGSALANLQMQLPALIIGGGLTAFDAATEMAAYYPVQVEKMLERFETLAADLGEDRLWQMYGDEEAEQMQRFLVHGREIRRERERAALAGEEPDFIPLVREWGGVTLVYRKAFTDCPAYRLNHEEVCKALEEGISVAECLNPVEANRDSFGSVASVTFERQSQDEAGKWSSTGDFVTLGARSVCVAAGTSPNVVYEKEYPGTFKLDRRGQYFQAYTISNDEGRQLVPVGNDDLKNGFFTSYEKDGRHISFYGDNHPHYAGNVVKAMASAKHGFVAVTALFPEPEKNPAEETTAEREAAFRELITRLDDELTAKVVRVDRLTPVIVEVIVRAPAAARKFEPGQFYRLQNFERNSSLVAGTQLAMEGLALTGASSDPDRGLLSLIAFETGSSSRLCAMLKPGEKVIVMGPTGTPTSIPSGQTVLLAGGGFGNAVLFAIARALKAKNNQVIYFAGYRKADDVFKREEIEAAADQVIWSVDSGDLIEPARAHDLSFQGNIVEAMQAYAQGHLGQPSFDFKQVDRIIVIGSEPMMAAVKLARHSGILAGHFRHDHVAIGSINSPMQCMMKEICAQCLQKHVDPVTGKEGYVYSCMNQDQILDTVDFTNLNDRLHLNSVQEKLSNLWLDHILECHHVPMV